MPKSRRSKIISLTQTSKKNKEHKVAIIENLRDAVNDHDYLYLFKFENMRSQKFSEVRKYFREPDMEGNTSKVVLGKNKLMQIALGRTPEDEHSDNLRHVSKLISGNVGLLMTSRSRKDVESYFKTLCEEDYARSGCVSERTIILTNDMIATYPVSMVEHFRKLGLPVEVSVGQLRFTGGQQEYTLCKEGSILSVEQCRLLVHFGIKLSNFKLDLICRWSNGEFESYASW